MNGKPVLSRATAAHDQDTGSALLGRNGEGKFDAVQAAAGQKLKALEGDATASSKLRVGYFAQHQVDELHLDETLLQHLQREPPRAPPRNCAPFWPGSA